MKGGPKRPEYEPTDDVQRIGYGVEESGEVLAAVGKLIRWGPLSYNPELPEAERESNGAWVRRELHDLTAAIDRLPMPSAPMLAEELHDNIPSQGHPIANLVRRGAQFLIVLMDVLESREVDPSVVWRQMHVPIARLRAAIRFAHSYLDSVVGISP